MITTSMTKMENVWNTLQEPRCSTCLPNSYMLLLSALDQGWKIIKVELAPSWDQYGFIYLTTLKRPSNQETQQLILPQNSLAANLLLQNGTAVATTHPAVHQPAK
jgi:hypothetical protein